jgi:hypothetical protein
MKLDLKGAILNQLLKELIEKELSNIIGRGYHIYRKIWRPTIRGHKLAVDLVVRLDEA